MGEEKELVIRFEKNGEIIGHRGLGDEVNYPVTGTALESTTVCYIDLDFFKSTLKINNDFTISLLTFYAEELQRSERKMNNLADMKVKGRIATSLISLYNKFGITPDGDININFAQTLFYVAKVAGSVPLNFSVGLQFWRTIAVYKALNIVSIFYFASRKFRPQTFHILTYLVPGAYSWCTKATI